MQGSILATLQGYIPATLLSKCREGKPGRFSLGQKDCRRDAIVALKVFLQSSSVTTFTEIFLADNSEFLHGQTNTRDSFEKPSCWKCSFPLLAYMTHISPGVWVGLKQRPGARGLHGLPWIAIVPLDLPQQETPGPIPE